MEWCHAAGQIVANGIEQGDAIYRIAGVLVGALTYQATSIAGKFPVLKPIVWIGC